MFQRLPLKEEVETTEMLLDTGEIGEIKIEDATEETAGRVLNLNRQ